MALNVRMMAGSSFKAADLNAGPIKLTIKSLEEKEFDGKRKPVAYFEETAKTLILNVTNTNILCDLFGDEDTDMVGQQIELYQDKTKFMGKLVPCISIRQPE